MTRLARHGFDRVLSVVDSDTPFGPCRVSNELGHRRGFPVKLTVEEINEILDNHGEVWAMDGRSSRWCGSGDHAEEWPCQTYRLALTASRLIKVIAALDIQNADDRYYATNDAALE